MARRSAFTRLRALIARLPVPQDKPHYLLHLGESMLLGDRSAHFNAEFCYGWHHYPEPGGSEDLRRAYKTYLARQYALSAQRIAASGLAMEPTPGSKYAMSTLIGLSAQKQRRYGHKRPVILLPDPCYPAYVDAALVAECRLVFYPVSPGRGIQPLLMLMSRHQRDVCAVVVCNPGNPFGNGLSREDVRQICRHGGIPIIFDECYADLYCHEPLASPLRDIAAGHLRGENIVVCHTLSKRCGMPGLRSGFICGDPAWVADWAGVNRTCGVSLPQPVCRVSARLWRDTSLVAEHRELIARNIALFNEYFPDLAAPEAGFFVCIPVENDVLATQTLWREEAILAMPGSYLLNQSSTERGFLRLALVLPEKVTRDILHRLAAFFKRQPATRTL